MSPPRPLVTAVLAAACLLTGCAGGDDADQPTEPQLVPEPVTNPIDHDAAGGDADHGWARVYTWPDGLIESAEQYLRDRDLWLYDGVAPEVYRSDDGRWRVFWYRRNAFDAQVWWDFVELSVDGKPLATGTGDPFGGATTQPATRPATRPAES